MFRLETLTIPYPKFPGREFSKETSSNGISNYTQQSQQRCAALQLSQTSEAPTVLAWTSNLNRKHADRFSLTSSADFVCYIEEKDEKASHTFDRQETTNVRIELWFYSTYADVSIQGRRGRKDREKGTWSARRLLVITYSTYYGVIHRLPSSPIVVQCCNSEVSLQFPLKGNENYRILLFSLVFNGISMLTIVWQQ